MKQNIGTIDKVVRILAAVLIAILYFTNVISGTMAIVLLAIAAIFIATSLVGTCPIYLALGIGTKKKAASGTNKA